MDVVALIHKETNAYGISFPDFPGCVTASDSLQALLQQASEALTFHLEGMIEDGETVPHFRTLDELRADPEFAKEFASAELVSLLAVDIPGKAVKVTITMEEHLLKMLNAAAERHGFTRSGFIADAVRQKLKA